MLLGVNKSSFKQDNGVSTVPLKDHSCMTWPLNSLAQVLKRRGILLPGVKDPFLPLTNMC